MLMIVSLFPLPYRLGGKGNLLLKYCWSTFWFYSDTSPLRVLLEYKKKKKVEGARRSMEWREGVCPA